MNLKKTILFFITISFINCTSTKNNSKLNSPTNDNEFVIAFGSCNKQNSENLLWNEVLKNNPKLWIWGGDNIYSDTDNMTKMANDYKIQANQKGYASIKNKMEVIGTWDDHDYGINDGGKEFKMKNEAQQLFLDFMDVAKNEERRKREGIYHSKIFKTSSGTLKVIILDTRFFRDSLVRKNGVYLPNETGSILGNKQWNWFTNEINNSNADFNIIVSSIQILSSEHRFEKWSNFPSELAKFKKVVGNSGAKGVIVLTGDRHISEFTKTKVDGLDYPLIDFTSSGLTHSSTHFSGEPNKNRVLKVVKDKSFGLLKIDLKSRKVTMQMRGLNNIVQQEITQVYP